MKVKSKIFAFTKGWIGYLLLAPIEESAWQSLTTTAKNRATSSAPTSILRSWLFTQMLSDYTSAWKRACCLCLTSLTWFPLSSTQSTSRSIWRGWILTHRWRCSSALLREVTWSACSWDSLRWWNHSPTSKVRRSRMTIWIECATSPG